MSGMILQVIIGSMNVVIKLHAMTLNVSQLIEIWQRAVQSTGNSSNCLLYCTLHFSSFFADSLFPSRMQMSFLAEDYHSLQHLPQQIMF